MRPFFERSEFAAGGPPALLARTALAGPRFELEAIEPGDGPIARAVATDRDLRRTVRLLACVDPEAAGEFAARVESLLCLDHPGLLAVHRVVRMPDGAPLAVVQHLPVGRADLAALADPARWNRRS